MGLSGHLQTGGTFVRGCVHHHRRMHPWRNAAGDAPGAGCRGNPGPVEGPAQVTGQATGQTATPPPPTPAQTMVPASTSALSTRATVTAQLTATPTISAAPTASDVLYQDDFTDPSSGWPDELVFDNYYVGYHEPDFYHVEVHVPHDNAIVVVPGRTFDNFAAETGVVVAEANTAPGGDFRYGLVFRRSGNHYYAFAISSRTRTWYVLKSTSTGQQVLGQGTQKSIQGLKSLDTLAVNAQGPAMTFYVNHQQVSQVNDEEYADGELGFYVETFDSSKAHIHYDSLVIRRSGDSSPSATLTPGPSCQVVAATLDLRSAPGRSSQPVLAVLNRGSQLVPVAAHSRHVVGPRAGAREWPGGVGRRAG